MAATLELDAACAEAVDLARAAAVRRAGVIEVGEHRGVVAEDVRVATHLFECTHPGYPGWVWSVTVVRASRARVVTVSEVTLVPGEGALLAPAWVPWADRVGPKDLTPGVLAPAEPDDVRLEPGYTGGEFAADADPAEASQTRALVAELGLGRERVLSVEGRDDAVERWLDGPGGSDNAMTQQAPGLCETCGFFVGVTGALGRVFGVCTNELSPSDGTVVSRAHGCGGHSDVVAPSKGVDLSLPVWDTISIEEGIFH
ncbi:MAG: DUF3027 domain-containing protein [Propionicimonas sp.]|uniref:DUF3027 domain-containing protein n=1 Tax=Propionicimonas sp. TaxID=1955623 RepID=UPI003D0A603B